jgi:hypothetical protein
MKPIVHQRIRSARYVIDGDNSWRPLPLPLIPKGWPEQARRTADNLDSGASQ